MELFRRHTGRKVALYFLITILVGTVLLYLPVSAADEPVSLIDALFTSTSAVCVTGLIVLDTGKDFSTFGQVVILLLIQLGGLGIMVFATGLLLTVGMRLSLFHRLGVTDRLGTVTGISSGSLMKAVIAFTMFFEGIGFLVLFGLFLSDGFTAGDAAFNAVFHSVSAFCNAGFSTFTTSIEHFSHNSAVILTFSSLIILGGLGFAVLWDVFSKTLNRKQHLSLHTKLCLSVTVILLIAGSILFIISERNNLLADRSLDFILTNAFFQSVTCRTAGFNSLPQTGLTETSLTASMLLMFIGACSGSTGGGIKVTTFAIVVLLAFHRFFGHRSVSAFKRSVSSESIMKALTVILLASFFIAAVFLLLMYVEEKPVSYELSHGWFTGILFETVSAFGTVGLSLGATSALSGLGKIIVIITMFSGRVGLLTLAFALARPSKKGEIVYLDEPVAVG